MREPHPRVGDECEGKRLIHPSAWRGCMKSGPRRVFRYSSRYEKALPDGSLRRRMEIHRTPLARPQGTRTPQDPRSSRDFERHLLPPKERLPVVAAAAPRLPQVAHRLPLLQKMAHRRHLGEGQPGYPPTVAGSLGQRSSAKRWRGRFPVCKEHGGRRGRARLRPRQEGQGPQAASAGRHRGLRAQGEDPQRQGDGLRGDQDAAAADERAVSPPTASVAGRGLPRGGQGGGLG
jgi:hypothetical protein